MQNRYLVPLVVAFLAALGLAPVPSSAQAPASSPPAAAAAPDDDSSSDWPRAIDAPGGTLETYQPQLEKFEGVKLSGRSAVAWTEKDKTPVFGVIWFTATVSIDRDARRVQVESLRVTKVRFPNSSKEQEQKLASLIEAEVPKWDLSVSLDTIQANLAVSQAERRSSEGLKSTPPRMIFSNEPAVLLLYAGKPVEQPVSGTKLRRVVNTPMFVVQDPATARYYLAGGKYWYEAAAATGPFAPVAAPSPAVKQFFDQNPPKAEETSGDAAEKASEQAAMESATPPRIVVSTEPAELYVFDGPPRYKPVGDDASLLYAENSQREVLVYVPTSETYVLASGRWFKARSLDGPWSAVRPDQLPDGFARLPPDSPVGEVRTFVAGTDEAQDALADAQIPQTSAVKRDQKFEVSYDGEPRFKAIEGTSMAFAVNTQASVIQDAGKYWACDQAVWYVATSPRGPWTVSDRRPPDIDQVPPSAPVYNTRYVYVYQSTPQVVYVGYLPGYVGMYPYYGTVVYGTGFTYAPWVGPTVYYPRPVTYGFGVTYNPWVGFGVTFGMATPFVSVGIRFGGYGSPYYRPGWWGPPGYRPYPPPYPGGWYRPPPGYRPPYPGYGYRPPPPGGYRPPPGGGYPGARPPPPRPGGWNNNLYARPDNRTRNVSRDQAVANRPAPRPANKPNNVYADKKGNVYRQNSGGSWDRNTASGWKPQATSPGQSRPATQPQSRPTQQPQARPSQQPQVRPAQPSTPKPQGGGGGTARPSRPSYPSAPAGLSRDAAARQRSAPATRGGGGGHGQGGGGKGR